MLSFHAKTMRFSKRNLYYSLIALSFLLGCKRSDPSVSRERFLGEFTAVQFSETFNRTRQFPVEIVSNGEPFSGAIFIKNFYNQGMEARARVDFFSFVIPLQRIDSFEIEGIGRLGVGEIIMDYTVENVLDDTVPIDVCRTVLSTQ